MKHEVSPNGLEIRLRWFDFRKRYNITWITKTTSNGKIVHVPTWPQAILEFNKTNSVTYTLVGNGDHARTPDGRLVEMKDIIFRFPNKGLAALFKLSYL